MQRSMVCKQGHSEAPELHRMTKAAGKQRTVLEGPLEALRCTVVSLRCTVAPGAHRKS